MTAQEADPAGDFSVGDLLSDGTKAAMWAAADQAYESRIAEGVEYQVDLVRSLDPDLFLELDIEGYRRETERRLRASELDDWPIPEVGR